MYEYKTLSHCFFPFDTHGTSAHPTANSSGYAIRAARLAHRKPPFEHYASGVSTKSGEGQSVALGGRGYEYLSLLAWNDSGVGFILLSSR